MNRNEKAKYILERLDGMFHVDWNFEERYTNHIEKILKEIEQKERSETSGSE